MLDFIPFSIRHKDYIKNKKIDINISKKLRDNILNLLNKYNLIDNYTEESALTDVIKELDTYYEKEDLYGKHKLIIKHNITTIILNSYPIYVLDSIELFYQLINKDENFKNEINKMFSIENSCFLFHDETIIKMDSFFLESEVLSKSQYLLKNNYFDKALVDFNSARENYTSGDYSGTISECNNAIESLLLKLINKKQKLRQNEMKKQLMKLKIIPDFFQGFIDNFEGILQSIFSICNESARHGKKEIPEKNNKINESLASFVLHLTGTLIVFIIKRYIENDKNRSNLG